MGKGYNSASAKSLFLLFWACFLLLSKTSVAQNDTPCSASPITVSNGTCNFSPATTVGASFQSDGANGGFPSCGFPGSPDVWFSFVVPASGAVAITLDPGTITDAALAVYSGSCANPQLIACDDDSGLDFMPAIDRSDFTPGQTLFIRVWNNNSSTGTFGVCVTESHSDCGTATLLCNNLVVTSNAYGGGSEQDGDWSGINCIPDEYQSQWFKFQVINPGTFSFTLTPDAIAPGMFPDYDWTLWRVTTSPFCESFLPSQQAIACNASSSMGPNGETGIGPTGLNPSEPAGPGNPYSASFAVAAGDVFYLWVNNFTNSSSGFHFEFGSEVVLNCDFDDEDPTIVTTSTKTCPGTCAGSASTVASNMTAPLTYAWSANAGGQNTANIHNLCAGIYMVTVTASDGEIIHDTVEVQAYPSITLQTSKINNTSCETPNGQAVVSASGGAGSFSYAWNSSTSTNDTLSGINAGTYTVTVSDGNNCSNDTSIVVSNQMVYPIISSIERSDSVACSSMCTSFSAQVVNGTLYQWDFGDGQTSTVGFPNHCYTAPGDYAVRLIVSNAGGCKDTIKREHFIHINPKPTAHFYANTSNDLHVVFTDHSIGSIQHWLWQLGDSSLSSSDEKNPEFDYPDFGKYCVQLQVWDENNCSDIELQYIEFKPELTVYIPNAFSPNDDGLNDVFRIQGEPFKVLKFWVYNRWGEELFFTSDPSSGWDGRRMRDGNCSPQDTYIYKTEILGEHGEIQEMTGSFLLIH